MPRAEEAVPAAWGHAGSNLRPAGRAEIPQRYVYLQKVEAGRAFLRGGPGIFTYLVDDIDNLEFEAFYRTQGWVRNIVLRDDKAYVPSGYYGVQVLELGSQPSPRPD